jgi:hypothetical protein
MQTLSGFLDAWNEDINALLREVSLEIERDKDMFYILPLEPHHQAEVDALVLAYAESLSVASGNQLIGSRVAASCFEVRYLTYIRLVESRRFGQFLQDCGFEEHQKLAFEWIHFLAVDSWEYTRFKWRFDFMQVYPPPKQGH